MVALGAGPEILDVASAEAEPEVAAALVALNNADAEKLSPLSIEAFEALRREAFAAWRIGAADALLIAFAEGAAYESANYRWFSERFDRFVYVDRVVVAASARGRGLARTLYAALADATRASGRPRIGCEVNLTPPNPASHAFHEALGYAPVGEATSADGDKRVRYYQFEIAHAR